MPVEHPTLDAFLFRPVIAGLWRHKELHDGSFTFLDLLDAHELLDVKEANEKAFRDFHKNK